MTGSVPPRTRSEEFASSSYFPPLDGLRALSVLLVMANHLPQPSWLPNVVFGWIGVFVFFVISGFLITTLLLREEERAGKISLSAFYLRRVFRILPVYYAVLILYVAICLLPWMHDKWDQFRHGLPYFVLFFQEYLPASAGTVFGHSWSLGVEEKFYFLWPFCYFVALRKWRHRWLAPLLACAGFMVFGYSKMLCTAYLGIAVGCVLAVVMHSGIAAPSLRRLASAPVLVPLGGVVGTYLLLRVTWIFVIGFEWAIAYLLLHLLLSDSWLRRALSLGPMVWLGRRSYSMYLFHVLCLNVVEVVVPVTTVPRFFGVLFLAFGLTAAVSHVSYTWIEEPAIALGKRIIRRRAESR
jgi:peptidoglycan/LPS O-acetylase OafA/YrhL